MSEWAAVAIIGIIAAYKLIDRWFDSRDVDETRETDTYTSTELAEHRVRDDGERVIPDIQLGFQRE